MARFDLDVSEFERLQKAIQDFPGNAERAINEVLHGEGGTLIEEEIRRLMPVSGRDWSGKKAPAKSGKSLTNEPGNLSVTVKTTKNYQYLYFPDDGSSTKNHVGNKQFFLQGAENKQSDITDRCINRLVNSFEEAI